LTEADWAQRLRVNRSALREAFARLHAEGLIEAGARTGYLVPELSRQDVFEVLSVRLALESSAIETICQAGLNTPQRLKRMQEACDLLEHLVDEEYHLSSVEADWRFHEALIAATGNRRLGIVYRHAPVPMITPVETWGAAWAQRSRLTVSEHRAILAAILDGDPDAAKGLLRSHLLGPWQGPEKPEPRRPFA
jgi:DNA-binding GntR family transcriptional regulator